MRGRWCTLEPLELEQHVGELHAAHREAPDDTDWTYLGYGPFEAEADYRAWLQANALGSDPLFFAIRPADSKRAAGVASYLRIQPEVGVLEIGHVCFSRLLQQTAAATEAMALMLRRTFDELGYRRCEWKCDALNERSRRAAERLGFEYEGAFRQATVYKGHNRDSAWFSMLDSEWPAHRAALERWLSPENFDAEGRQRQSLSRSGG